MSNVYHVHRHRHKKIVHNPLTDKNMNKIASIQVGVYHFVSTQCRPVMLTVISVQPVNTLSTH